MSESVVVSKATVGMAIPDRFLISMDKRVGGLVWVSEHLDRHVFQVELPRSNSLAFPLLASVDILLRHPGSADGLHERRGGKQGQQERAN